ncbi:MAG: ParA family protein [Gammaproteobacteria bacterium]
MNAKILASYNLKGGVGKTTAAVNLAFAATKRGRSVLVWDLDPQGAATYFFRVKPKVKGGGKKLINGKRELADFIKGTNYENLDLMPADFSYRNLDLYLKKKHKTRDRLARLIDPIQRDYDFVILDSPPGISLLSENIFCASDVLVIPLIPTYLSIRAYDGLQHYFRKRSEIKTQLMPFFSMVDRRRRLHQDVVAEFTGSHPEALKTFVAYSAIVELMGRYRAPLQSFAERTEPAQAFDALWEELKLRLGGLPSVSETPVQARPVQQTDPRGVVTLLSAVGAQSNRHKLTGK